MNILITGASGFVGQSLTQVLLQQGHLVTATYRNNELSQHKHLRSIRIESIDARTSWKDVLEGIDVVVHLAARVHVMRDQAPNPLAEFRKVNVEGTARLAQEALRAGVKRFIYMSSVKVNGEFTQLGKPFAETDAEAPQDDYGRSKYEAEITLKKICQNGEMNYVIVRPPLIYGPGVKANFASMVRAVSLRLPLPFGCINNQRSLIDLQNLVAFISCCISNAQASNQIFLVSDGQDVSTTTLLKSCADALKVPVRLIPVPQWLLERALCLIGKRGLAQRLCGNLQVNITKARILLGWVPPVSVESALQAMMAEH